MTRPLLEVADIVRAQGDRFIRSNFRWFHWAHLKVLRAIARCRTAALGGHRDQCPRCGYRTTSYNSCRDRHCPKCQSGARDKWIMARQSELLPVPYVHVVFTLPHQLSPLALQNKKVLYDLLFRASAERPYKRSPATLATWEPTLASFLSCIPGDRICWLILTSTASFPPVDSRPTAPAGSIPATHSSCPFTYSVASSAASSSPV
jgi:predicted Zn-ribbon and HTH transcriptional regulator